MAYSLIARYSAMHYVANFRSQHGDLRLRDRIVVRTDRGAELAEVISVPEEINAGQPAHSFVGEVLRKVTPADLEREADIVSDRVPAELKFCQQKIRDHELPMKLVAVEHLFGGDKIIVYYLADGRVDFRQLVKDLAAEYRTRIEMRQIGVRDEARLLADYEHCGREICCKKFIKNLEPVTMRMAKLQKSTLDPSKISGRCGRLMCCLRFEDEIYAELRSNLPRRGTRVRVEQGWGHVVGGDILRQTVQLHLEDGQPATVKVSDILQRQGRAERSKREPPKDATRPPRKGDRDSDRRGRRDRRDGRPNNNRTPKAPPNQSDNTEAT